ncbi:aminotransferase class IV [Pontibacter rugosus]|uniref:branched-chain-amino-acid transaminase n=1 Tax=Pontibacter rugosus TaxID=1745966 RepID=A0ABW3STD0_9BACT
MFILYNNQLIQAEALQVPLTDRAFQYNDGFFETAILVNGQLRFWRDHLQRIKEAATALQLVLPEYFFEADFVRQLQQLATQEQASVYGRLKLKVWRAGGGLYTPQTNQVNWLATIAPAALTATTPLRVGICQQVHTVYTSVSAFKGPNAPLYILAGLEKQAKQQDDMLLLHTAGHLAELISSNIFWVIDNVLYTPALQTGCVNGIMRRNIIRWCLSNGIKVQEVLQEPSALYLAEEIFSANVTGIRGISSIDGNELQQQHKLSIRLRRALHL